MENIKNARRKLYIIEETLNYMEIEEISRITEGWSTDEKYLIEDSDKNKYLLRIMALDRYFKNKAIVNHQNKISDKRIIKVQDTGMLSNGLNPYNLINWKEGKDLIKRIDLLPSKKQYELGYEAGQILRIINSTKIDEDLDVNNKMWTRRKKKQIHKLIRGYGQVIENNEESLQVLLTAVNNKKLLEIINIYVNKLEDRPISFKHGDYHIGNMILDKENKLFIIDFDRAGFGDPYEEFDRFVFTWSKSIEFANGQIHGYFNGNVPYNFFEMLLFYQCKHIMSSLIWSIGRGEKEVATAVENIIKIKDSYDNFYRIVPNWYKEANIYR